MLCVSQGIIKMGDTYSIALPAHAESFPSTTQAGNLVVTAFSDCGDCGDGSWVGAMPMHMVCADNQCAVIKALVFLENSLCCVAQPGKA